MKASGFLFLVFLNFLVVQVDGRSAKREAEVGATCPADWDPSPCKCFDENATHVNRVNCDEAKNGDEIKEVFAKLDAEHRFKNFIMDGTGVETLPDGVFGKASFEMIAISNSKLSHVGDVVFQGSEETLVHIILHANNIEKFNFKSLQPLKKLRYFELSSDFKLNEIPDEAFGEKSLEAIDLNGNKIENLGKNAFQKLPKLRKIDLSSNKLTELKEDSFNLSPEIQPISLLISNNEISKIDKNAFRNVKVRTMEIEGNKLEYLDQEIFEPLLKSLTENGGSLSTYGNPFTCEESTTKWVSEMPNWDGNLIGYVCKDGRALQELTFA